MNNRPTDIRILKKCMRDIGKMFDCRVVFGMSQKVSGWQLKRLIYVSLHPSNHKNRYDLLLSAFFHELAHEYNRRFKKFSRYHDDYCGLKYFKRVSWRAEIYTEKIGKQLMKDFFPGMKFTAWYVPGVKWKKEWHNNFLMKK